MTDQTPRPEAILSLASQLADGAAEHTLKWFRAPALVTQNKWAEGFDPVTEADKAAELAMRALIVIELRYPFKNKKHLQNSPNQFE